MSKEHSAQVKSLIQSGQTTLTVYDTDAEAYRSGWARYLMANYVCTHSTDSFTADLNKKV